MNNRLRFPNTLLLVATCPASISAAEVSDAWVVAPVLTSGTRLPVPPGYTVSWRADGRALPAGILTNPGPGDRFVRLEGTLMRPGASKVVKRFSVRLLGSTARRLTAYALTPNHGGGGEPAARRTQRPFRAGRGG